MFRACLIGSAARLKSALGGLFRPIGGPMADDVLQQRRAAPEQAHSQKQWQRVAVLSALTVVLIAFVGAGMLWVHYGTAVFFETIAAGIAACF